MDPLTLKHEYARGGEARAFSRDLRTCATLARGVASREVEVARVIREENRARRLGHASPERGGEGEPFPRRAGAEALQDTPPVRATPDDS